MTVCYDMPLCFVGVLWLALSAAWLLVAIVLFGEAWRAFVDSFRNRQRRNRTTRYR